MTKRRERHIRFRAVKPGDDLYHDGKWWQVKAVVAPGTKFTGKTKDDKPVEFEVPQFNPEHKSAFQIARGSIGTVVAAPRDSVVRIIREAA